jgi:hypothetical protein
LISGHFTACSTFNNQLALSIANPDIFTSAWSLNTRLASINLLYRKAGDLLWSNAVNADGSVVTFPFAVTSVCSFQLRGCSVDAYMISKFSFNKKEKEVGNKG